MKQPYACPRMAHLAMRGVVERTNAPNALLRGAVAIALAMQEKTTHEAVGSAIDQICNTVRNRIYTTEASRSAAVLAHLHQLLFDEHVLHAPEKYTHESFAINQVVRRFRGAPSLMALLYLECLRRLDFVAHGVSVPGRMLVAIQGQTEGVDDGTVLYIDPSDAGREMDGDNIAELFQAAEMTVPDQLELADTKLWLTRIIQNVISVVGEARQYHTLAAMLELEILLWPDAPSLVDDLSKVYAAMGNGPQA